MPKIDAKLLRLCKMSCEFSSSITENHALASAARPDLDRITQLDAELAQQQGGWLVNLRAIAKTPAKSAAGIRAKAKICQKALLENLDGDLDDPEMLVVCSLLGDILNGGLIALVGDGAYA